MKRAKRRETPEWRMVAITTGGFRLSNGHKLIRVYSRRELEEADRRAAELHARLRIE